MIRFNFPSLAGDELKFLTDVLEKGRLAGDGEYTRKCSQFLEHYLGAGSSVLLTHSCTAALEMAALLIGVGPGDEVIMPSYTFVSTANAFVLRGAVPVFVDVRPDTLNLDERLVESALTNRTRAIVPVHYAGVSCEMDSLNGIARRHGLHVIEDAAQAIGSTFHGRRLGTLGDLGCFSFHETKNIVSGEGGALVLNRREFLQRAEIIREKGTNRSRFFRGEVDKYTWVDLGSSYLPGELIAAFLLAQLQKIEEITARRMVIWNRYHRAFEALELEHGVRRPMIPEGMGHNAHLYYLIASSQKEQARILEGMKAAGVNAVFHYVPLHSAEAGIRFGRTGSSMAVTDDLASRLVRLPLYPSLTDEQVAKVIEVTTQIIRKSK